MCDHNKIVIETSEHVFILGGDLIENTIEYTVCLDCGSVLKSDPETEEIPF